VKAQQKTKTPVTDHAHLQTLYLGWCQKKSEKGGKTGFTLPPWVPSAEWEAYEDMRKKIRKPMTDKARELAITKLGKLQAEGNDPAEVLNQSTLNAWAGLFAIKADRAGGGFDLAASNAAVADAFLRCEQ